MVFLKPAFPSDAMNHTSDCNNGSFFAPAFHTRFILENRVISIPVSEMMVIALSPLTSGIIIKRWKSFEATLQQKIIGFLV